jgi:ribosomal protein L9
MEKKTKKKAVKKEKPEWATIDLTFNAESKEALESGEQAKLLVEDLQKLTLDFTKETQKLGLLHGMSLETRIVYNVKLNPGGL